MAGGVTRLTERRVTSFAEGETVSAISTTTDGSIWLGTRTGLIRFLDGRQQRYAEGDGLPSSNIVSLHSQGGTLWVATQRGVVRLIDGSFRPLRTPGGVVLQRVRSMSTDSDGGVWISDLNDGLFRFSDGVLTRVEAIRDNVLDALRGQSRAPLGGATQRRHCCLRHTSLHIDYGCKFVANGHDHRDPRRYPRQYLGRNHNRS